MKKIATRTILLLIMMSLASFTLVACTSNAPLSDADSSQTNTPPTNSNSVEQPVSSGIITIDNTKTLVGQGIVWGEGPRWVAAENKLYFADIMGQKILRTDLYGNLETVVEVPGMPSGSGFLPDGRLLIVSGLDGTLYTFDGSGLTEYVDIYGELEGTEGINDMVVNKNGGAYVGCYGYDITQYAGGPAPGWIAYVTPDQKVIKTGDDVMCPKGMVITPDGKTLIVADTIARLLLAWDIEADGTLANRRVFAELEDGPDGIALDAEGAVWAALPNIKEVVRVQDGGQITHRVNMKNKPLAVMLGGADRKTLFIVTVISEDINNPLEQTDRASYIEYIEDIEVSGAGLP
jgi:sugar lactone lactonase YvrE